MSPTVQYVKPILSKGTVPHWGKEVEVDDAFLASLKTNFDAGVLSTVRVALAAAGNKRSDDPTLSIGEVFDLQITKGKVYADIGIWEGDVQDYTYFSASALLSRDYLDTSTNKRVGPTLLHIVLEAPLGVTEAGLGQVGLCACGCGELVARIENHRPGVLS